MQRYIVRRVIESAVTLVFVSALIFALVRASGDPVMLLLPPEALGAMSQEELQQIRHDYGLDAPLVVQYGQFVANALHGDLGNSIRQKEPSLSLYINQLPNTLQLACLGLLFALGLGLPIGILSAVRPGGYADRFGRLFALTGQAMPAFWIGIVLILLFSVSFKLFPTSGKGQWASYVLPSITIGWYSMAALMRLTRSCMLQVLASDYIKLARIEGLPELSIITKYALKNALIPIMTLASLQFVVLLNGSIVTETIFAWPGVGRLLVDAIMTRDYPVVQTVVLMSSALLVAVNLAVDIMYCYLDPRIRYN